LALRTSFWPDLLKDSFNLGDSRHTWCRPRNSSVVNGWKTLPFEGPAATSAPANFPKIHCFQGIAMARQFRLFHARFVEDLFRPTARCSITSICRSIPTPRSAVLGVNGSGKSDPAADHGRHRIRSIPARAWVAEGRPPSATSRQEAAARPHQDRARKTSCRASPSRRRSSTATTSLAVNYSDETADDG